MRLIRQRNVMARVSVATALVSLVFVRVPTAVAVTPAAAPRGGSALGLVEVSPLRSAVGQAAFRGELFLAPKVALGLAYDGFTAASERRDFTDQHRSLAAEAVFYPLGLGAQPVFIGTGLRLEQADVGRQRPRDTVTWARTNADESNDTWVNHDTYNSWTQSIGYRVLTAPWLTLSLRLVRDELLATESRSDSSRVVSDGVDLASRGREPVLYQLTMHAGLWFH